ncbi:MAG: basic amino acid ABC transporter substrate-binding protein [Firmicutes bacterium]|nr:basic amino acid ABC transporter substrate-binding protein [Bacillota bacterium]
MRVLRGAFWGVLLVGLVFFGVGCKGKKNNVLKVGSDCTYPPMEFQEGDEIKGFDIDLIKAIAEEMGREVEIVNVGWDGIIPGLINGNYDVLISAMTITEERQAQINFSDPYFTAGQLILVRADDDRIKSDKDLVGKKVGVQTGTTGDITVSAMEGVTVVRFNTNPDAVQELRNGGVDAVVADSTTLMWEATKDEKLKLVSRTPFSEEYYGIGVKKGNDKLLNEINRALATIKKNGKYDEIMEKWFGK